MSPLPHPPWSQYAHILGLDFYAHEKFLNFELPWGKMAYLVILRHPFDRLLSNGKHDGFKCRPKQTWHGSGAEASEADGGGGGGGLWSAWGASKSPELQSSSTRLFDTGSPRRQAKSFNDYVQCSERNVMVRRICGCLGRPDAADCGQGGKQGSIPEKQFTYYQMTRKHLDCAKDRLSRFSAVLVTEMLADAETLLAYKFGWSVGDANTHRGGTSADSR